MGSEGKTIRGLLIGMTNLSGRRTGMDSKRVGQVRNLFWKELRLQLEVGYVFILDQWLVVSCPCQ
jgi:hypothetical protein